MVGVPAGVAGDEMDNADRAYTGRAGGSWYQLERGATASPSRRLVPHWYRWLRPEYGSET